MRARKRDSILAFIGLLARQAGHLRRIDGAEENIAFGQFAEQGKAERGPGDDGRGGPQGDLDAFVQLVVTAGKIVTELGPALKELDLNPISIRPAGKGAWPLDALCVFDD